MPASGRSIGSTAIISVLFIVQDQVEIADALVGQVEQRGCRHLGRMARRPPNIPRVLRLAVWLLLVVGNGELRERRAEATVVGDILLARRFHSRPLAASPRRVIDDRMQGERQVAPLLVAKPETVPD